MLQKSIIQTIWTNSTKPMYDQFHTLGFDCSTRMEHIVYAY